MAKAKTTLPKYKDPEPVTKYVLPSGTTRSTKAPSFHLIPRVGLVRIADRFQLGLEKHGEGNWERSLLRREDAKAFAVEAYNHLIDHALKMADGDNDGDHVGAIGWAVCALAKVEATFGVPWQEL
jgi:hypothetical protein